MRKGMLLAAAGLGSLAMGSRAGAQQAIDPLPSWNEGTARRAIISFVTRVTDHKGADFVAPAERIAVFDNDGTLWCEQPVYTQAAFVVDRIRALAPQHPEWRSTEPYRSVLAGDAKGVSAAGVHGIARLMASTHSGMTTDEFAATVKEWLATAINPRFGRRYVDCVYQPMLELMSYLRKNGFKTFLVSGGGADFMRVFAESAYSVPPEQVIGSTGKVKFEMRDGVPVLVKLPELDLLDDGPGKPAGIHRAIGRRPVMAFGNSDGDLQMLQWTTAASGPRFGLLVHHTDDGREAAYDRASHVGKLDKALDEAGPRGWTVVDMKRDWKTIFPPQ